MLSLGIESASDDLRQDMMKRLERQKIQTAFRNMREAGIKSFAFFILGYPGDTAATIEQTTKYALELDPDFANFYPAVPYPGTEMYEKCRRDGLLTTDDWSKLEYSYYVLRGNGLDEHTSWRPSTAPGGGSSSDRDTSCVTWAKSSGSPSPTAARSPRSCRASCSAGL